MLKIVPIGFTSLSRASARMRLKGDSRVTGDQGRVRDDFVANNRIDKLVQSIAVLIVDDNQYMRKVVRNILVNIGVKNIHEASDGIAGLEAIRMFAPDLVILDWEMPLLNGAELVRIVRSPGVFPVPDVPIIMLTGHVERWRVIEASRLGVNEFLRKPVSGKSLLDRIVAILTHPRAMVRLGDYYGPEPRKLFYEPMQKMGVAPPTAPEAPDPGAPKLMV
jgi:two-component system, chemotaxis family, chemotaxis protein CheY